MHWTAYFVQDLTTENLTRNHFISTALRARRSDGRVELLLTEESPGSMETRRRVTPGQVVQMMDDLRESATENIPPSSEGKGEKVR